MQCKERLLFFSTPFGQLVESLVDSHHGWRTRESQAMGRRLRENMVIVLAYFLHSHLNAVFPLTLPAIEKVVFFFPQGGSEGGWIRLPQSLRWGDSFPIQKEKVSMFIHAKRWDMVLLQHRKFPIMCCWVFLFHSLWQLCHTDVLSLWHVCFSKFHRIIESYGQVRLGMVSQQKISLFNIAFYF